MVKTRRMGFPGVFVGGVAAQRGRSSYGPTHPLARKNQEKSAIGGHAPIPGPGNPIDIGTINIGTDK